MVHFFLVGVDTMAPLDNLTTTVVFLFEKIDWGVSGHAGQLISMPPFLVFRSDLITCV